MRCSGCNKEKSIFARQLCQACYYRLRRNGTLARKHEVNRGICKIPECGRNSVAKNFCLKHYQQRRFHPLRATWRLLRSRAKNQYPSDWDNFAAFLEAVGGRPSKDHQLRRPDPEKPWGLDNFVWREPIGRTGVGGLTAAEYARLWHLRKMYGLHGSAPEEMYEAQGGLCPICTRQLGLINEETGKPVKTCIDHDHKTRRVRGLVCDYCNKGLGMFNDSKEALRNAIRHIERSEQEQEEAANGENTFVSEN